jgi:beta-glucanase (GH16 family)
MKKIYLFVLLCFSVVPSLYSQTWLLVWSDEFNYSGLPDSAKWGYEVGYIRNNELQYYTLKRIENANVTNGALHIIGRKESYNGMGYTAASINTSGKYSWTYGKIEARMKIPMGKGYWPAFWMLGQNIGQVGWPKCGEIDIMEHINTENKIYGTIHWDNIGHASYGGSLVTTPDQYHLYTIEWDSAGIKWFVDGVNYWNANILNNINSTEEFHKPHYILLNLAIGGDWPGSPDGTTVFPDTFFVDYVRVYKKTTGANSLFCIGQSAPVIDGTEENFWSPLQRDSLKSVVIGTVASASDLSANYKAAWDANALYFFVNVKDDSLRNDSGTAVWDDDAVELFIDGNNEKDTAYDSNDRQYIFRWNDNTVYEFSNAVAQSVNPSGVTFAQKNISGGYSMEIKVNWTALGVTPAPGKLIGFDMHVDDDDNGSGRDKKIAWIATADQSSKKPSTFGTIKLDSVSCGGGTTAISTAYPKPDFAVYPNPTAGKFQVSGSAFQVQYLEIYNSLGEKVFSTTNTEQQTTLGIDLSAQPGGIYFIKMQTEKGLLTRKLIIQN